MNKSALVVLVPEAEDVVKPFREKYDAAAGIGMPAHITLLFPFIAPTAFTSKMLGDLNQLFSRFASFDYALTVIRRFPNVLYLAPDPGERFRELTLEIWRSYPEFPPYEGRHPDIVPHLCVALLNDEQQLDGVCEEFEASAAETLPVRAVAKEVALMVNTSGDWQVTTKFPLGGEKSE